MNRLTGVLLLLLLLSFLRCTLTPARLSSKDILAGVGRIPEKWHEDPVVILSDSTVLTYQAGDNRNRVVEYKKIVYYVQKRQPNTMEALAVYDYSTIEARPRISMSVVYPDGKSWSLPAYKIEREKTTQEGIYSSNRYVQLFSVPRYQQGVTICLEVTRKYDKPEFLKIEYLRDAHNILDRSVSLRMPRDAQIKYELRNAENLSLDTATAVQEDTRTFSVRAGPLKSINPNNLLKYPEDWYAALHFSFPPAGSRSYTWIQMGDHYLSSIRDFVRPPSNIDSIVDRVRQTPEKTFIRQSFRFVQDRIRYFADLEKIHAFVPRPVNVVLKNGYGDCKEMSSLLYNILKAGGTNAGLALTSVSDQAQVVQDFPSLGGFNHMVVFLPGPDTSYQFIDPTNDHASVDNSYLSVLDQKALVLIPGASRIVTVQADAHYTNRVETGSEIRVEGGKLEMSGSIALIGYAAFQTYPILKKLDKNEKRAFLADYLSDIFGIRTRQFEIAENKSDRIEIRYTADISSHYLNLENGGIMLNVPSTYGGDVKYTTLDYEGPRYIKGFEQVDRWRLPEPFQSVAFKKIDHRLGRGNWTREKNSFERRYEVNKAFIPNDRRDELSEFNKQKRDFLKTIVWRN